MIATRHLPFFTAVIDDTGGNTKIQQRDYLPTGLLPVIDQGQNEIAGYTNDASAAYRGRLPVVLFGDHTRALKYVDHPFALGADGVKVLAPRTGFSAKFLYYFFLSCQIPSRGYSRHFKFLKELQIPLIAPSEQRQIVELLDEGDYLRRLRRDVDTKTEGILPALFTKMFGDPLANPMKWPEKALSRVIESVDAGWSAPSLGRAARDGEFGVLKVSAVTSGVFRPEEHKAVFQVEASKALVTPKRGDLLFSRANTRELIAASCVVERDSPNLFLSDKLWRLTPVAGEASTLFLKELFWRDGLRDKFRAASSGSSGSMLNIGQDAMLRTIAPIPPFEKQLEFERLAWRVMEITRAAETAGSVIEEIWSNVLQKAFTGELTANWRKAHVKELLGEMSQQARALNIQMPSDLEASP